MESDPSGWRSGESEDIGTASSASLLSKPSMRMAATLQSMIVSLAKSKCASLDCSKMMRNFSSTASLHQRLWRLRLGTILPKIQPQTMANRFKILDGHAALASSVHRENPSIETQDCDIVAAALQHARLELLGFPQGRLDTPPFP